MERSLSDHSLKSRGLAGQSRCILVQRWAELLNPNTIATYRARHLNAHTALCEISELIDHVLDGTITSSQLKPVREECIKLLRDDQTIATHAPEHRQQLLRNLGQLRPEERPSQYRLKYQISHSLPEISKEYVVWLLDDLWKAVESDSLSDIECITSSLVTELISMGWSQRALYEMRDFLVEALVSEEGWSNLKTRLIGQKREYECVVPVQASLTEGQKRLFEKLGFFIRDHSQLLTSPLFKNTPRVLPKTSSYLIAIDAAFDPFSALEYAEAKLSSALDLIEFCNFGRPRIHHLRIVGCRKAKPRRISIFDKWMQLPPEVDTVTFNAIAALIMSPNLCSIDKNRYATALAYYRMGMESREPTAKFINLWVALESFCRTPAFDHIIDCVTLRIPELLSNAYIYSLVRNYYEDCRRARVDLPGGVNTLDTYAHRRTVVLETIRLLRDPYGQETLREATAFYSLLSQRTEEMISLLSSPHSLIEKLTSHRQRLYWHIQRLYRVRNSIVHTGRVTTNLSALTLHLQDYVEMTLTQTAFIINSRKLTGIDEALERAVDNYEATKAVLEQGQSLDDNKLLYGVLG
jgi:hypothetical protein